MAKKAIKGKVVKKAAAKPVKKAAAKKAAPKKAAKPAKKVASKKVVKKAVAKKVAKPIKKAVAKKPIAKKVAKPVAKKIAPKKVVKPTKKVIAKKATAPVKKVVVSAKKVVAKPSAKAVKAPAKVIAKPTTTKVEIKKAAPAAKPVAVAKAVVPVVKKAEPLAKKKQDRYDLDEDNNRMDDEPMVVEYKTPSIQRPMGPVPTPHINTDKRTRYTDAELKEFKQLILKKLEEAQKDYELLKSTLSHKDDHGTDDTSPTFKLLEDGSDVLSKEETSHLASRQEKFIQNLNNALIRIENKTYGICRATGKLISKERLRSVPHATLAIEAKLEQNA
jgi:RNA polymerase-binding transcription factor DksA